MPLETTSELISIIIDSREPKALIEKFKIYPYISTKIDLLYTGDIIVGGLIIERKTYADLFASLVDGRLFDQISRLKKFSKRSLLIVEGFDDTIDIIDKQTKINALGNIRNRN